MNVVVVHVDAAAARYGNTPAVGSGIVGTARSNLGPADRHVRRIVDLDAITIGGGNSQSADHGSVLVADDDRA